jgi:hypothetical protein
MTLSSRELIHYFISTYGVSPGKADKLADTHVTLYGNRHPNTLTRSEFRTLKRAAR